MPPRIAFLPLKTAFRESKSISLPPATFQLVIVPPCLYTVTFEPEGCTKRMISSFPSPRPCVTLDVGSEIETFARRLLYIERAQPNTTPVTNIAFVVEGSNGMLNHSHRTYRPFLTLHSSGVDAVGVIGAGEGAGRMTLTHHIVLRDSSYIYIISHQ